MAWISAFRSKKQNVSKKCAPTVKHTDRKKISSFLSISGTGRDISKILNRFGFSRQRALFRKK
jgi:hypothetical protein